MTTRLRETNPLNAAAAWLSEQDDDLAGYQAEDILEDARLGKIELWAIVPEWQTTGEIDWLRRDKVIVDATSGAYTYTASAASNFLGSDGLIRVTAEIAKRLLDHGECSFDCVRMPIIDCSNEPKTTSEAWLQGSRDGRLIKISDVRVSKCQLHSFVKVDEHIQIIHASRSEAPNGVPTAKILSAPWQFPVGFTYKMLEGALKDRRKWISDRNAMLSSGRKGGHSATWNPAKVAIRLHEREHFTLNSLTRVMNGHFDSYLDEWNDYKAACI